MNIRWRVFPTSTPPLPLASAIAKVFEGQLPAIGTPANQLTSNEVLAFVRPGLKDLGFQVEEPGKGGRISVPVLFGENGKATKSYLVHAWQIDHEAS